MADKKEPSLNLSGGGSRVPTAGGEGFSLMSCTEKSMGFSLQPCTHVAEEAFAGDQSAPKRKKAPKKKKAPKRRVSEVVEEEPWRAVDSQLTLLEGEEEDDPGFDEFMVGLRASFAADMGNMLANNPNVMLVDFPECCVRPPGVEFPKPSS